MNPPSAPIVVGVVGRPWGRRGQFLVNPLGSDPERLLSRGTLLLRRPGEPGATYTVVGSHRAAGRLVVEVEGCDSPEDAASLRGAEVLVEASDFPPAPEGRYYPHELVGLEAVHAGGASLGRVERVLEGGGADLLVVRKGDKEVLVPFAEAICRVDRRAGRIDIDPPDGLLDLE